MLDGLKSLADAQLYLGPGGLQPQSLKVPCGLFKFPYASRLSNCEINPQDSLIGRDNSITKQPLILKLKHIAYAKASVERQHCSNQLASDECQLMGSA